MHSLHTVQIEPIIKRALEEDWGYRDWTTDICVEKSSMAKARVVAKQDLMVAGAEVALGVFKIVDPRCEVHLLKQNGEMVSKGTTLLEIYGPSQALLKGERVALNFMMPMCGIATLARRYVQVLEEASAKNGKKVQLLDTRKTTPGMRLLEKSATMLGGARNHRFGLCDGVMLKENHIRAAGGITKAMSHLLESLPPTIKVEVETTNLQEVSEALTAGADIIMLDNMSLESMREAVKLVAGGALLEASGNISLETLLDVAATGVDFISTSSIITKAPWADLSMLFEV